MKRSGHKGSPPSAAPGGDFARLIETEVALEARVAGARDDARRLVQTARDDAAAQESALEQDLAATRTDSETIIEGERARRAAMLLEQARQDSARFTAVDPAHIEELARYVVSRVIGEVPR